MKAIILLSILTIVFGFSQIAAAQTAEEVKIRLTKQKTINDNDLTIKFVSVLEDSRCAEGANCVWAGNAKIRLKLKKKRGAWKTFELNTNLEKNEIKFGGYKIKIAELNPTPKVNVRIDPNGYVATLSVDKS